MPRSSLKEIRSKEILAAYADCIVRFGFNGATQRRIAEAAGVKRTILRHYLGNREHMIQALLDHVCRQFQMETNELIAALPESNRVSELLNLLFDSQYAKENNSALVVQALMNASEQHPEINDRLMAVITQFIDAVAHEIQLAHPKSSEIDTFEVALGIVGIYFTIDSMESLGVSDDWWFAAERSAYRLIDTLKVQ